MAIRPRGRKRSVKSFAVRAVAQIAEQPEELQAYAIREASRAKLAARRGVAVKDVTYAEPHYIVQLDGVVQRVRGYEVEGEDDNATIEVWIIAGPGTQASRFNEAQRMTLTQLISQLREMHPGATTAPIVSTDPSMTDTAMARWLA